jgi:predicted metal-dependent hydrolase
MSVAPQLTDNWRDAAEFKTAVGEWAARIRVRPSQVRLQSMRRKWASCSREGVLSFSRDLLGEKRSFGEAVIVHELVHLRIRNHGRLFQSLIRSYLGARAFLAETAESRNSN